MRLTELDKLLADHQAIIDAWYDKNLARVKAHASAVLARRRSQSEDASRKRGE